MSPAGPASALPAEPGTGWQGFLAALTLRRVAITLTLALAVAALLNPIFVVAFPVLLGRTLFLATMLLLVFAAARQWPPRWRPRWVSPGAVPLLAVTLAAPVFTLVIYMVVMRGNVAAFVQTPGRISGFLWLTGSALVTGLLLTSAALVRERLADAERRALQLELERSVLERQAVDARLRLLQAQIEPHFLFNTLANVQALVESGSPRAVPVLRSLIAYLRAAMPRLHAEEPTLGDELALVRSYLELMQLRMPDRLQWSVDVDPALGSLPLPPMLLLTLVENAVRHGVDPSEEGGRIDVQARLENAPPALRLTVVDTGVGMADIAQPGTGLSNLRARLQAGFGAGAALQLSDNPPHGVRADIVLPR